MVFFKDFERSTKESTVAPPTVAPAPAPSPAPAPPNPTDILRAAGDMGFGAKAAKDIAAGLSAGAQLVRQKGRNTMMSS